MSRGFEPFKPFFSSTRGIEVSASFRFAPHKLQRQSCKSDFIIFLTDILIVGTNAWFRQSWRVWTEKRIHNYRKYGISWRRKTNPYFLKIYNNFGNRPASRRFQVDEKRVRVWRGNKATIEGLITTKKGKERSRLTGGGRKPLSTELEEVLLGWIESRRSRGLRVSRKLTMKKAEIIYGDLTKDMENVDEDFKASRGWLEKFMKKKWLVFEAQNISRSTRSRETGSKGRILYHPSTAFAREAELRSIAYHSNGWNSRLVRHGIRNNHRCNWKKDNNSENNRPWKI